MSLTDYQRRVCRLLASARIARGERYVAGGAALNEVLASARVSHDVDLFHDTREAVLDSWESDRNTLLQTGYDVRTVREFPTFVEAEVIMGREGVILQWVYDSAFRFFPLVEHPDFGLALHPFDLATNKVLAMIGRAEVRDWVDVIHCHSSLQPFGLLAWAACGKDPGLSPEFILAQASRSAHYTRQDVDTLAFEGNAPDVRELGQSWRQMLLEAHGIAAVLSEDHVGQCVMGRDGRLFNGTPEALKDALATNAILFHDGTVRGAWPAVQGAHLVN